MLFPAASPDMPPPLSTDMPSAQPRDRRSEQRAPPALPHPVRPTQAALSAPHDQATNQTRRREPMTTESPNAARPETEASATVPLPDLVLFTADITLLADGRSWKRHTVSDDPKVIALMVAAGGPGFSFYREIGDA